MRYRDHALREELALIYFEVVEATVRENVERLKAELVRLAEWANSEEWDALLEGRKPNTRTPRARTSGHGKMPPFFTYAPHIKGFVRNRQQNWDC